MSDLVALACVAAVIVAVILLCRCGREMPAKVAANAAQENLQTGYPWIRCPNGYTYDFDGSECVPSVAATMVGAGGRVLKF